MSGVKYTVLFTPQDQYGHINACHGIAETLRDRGHRAVFAIDEAFKGKLSIYGFDEELMSVPTPVIDANNKDEKDWIAARVIKFQDVFKQGPLAMTEKFCILGFETMSALLKKKDTQFKEIISRVKPDLIVIDSYMGSPTLTDSGIPWIWLYSAAPLFAWNNRKLPPPWSGLPTKGDSNQWNQFREKFEPLFENLCQMERSWYSEAKATPLSTDSPLIIHPRSPYLNVYMYPKELDYEEVPEGWQRVDGFVRTTGEKFQIPESLQKRSGKLVFISMGSIGCSHTELMKRLIEIFSKSEHRFIVAMGRLYNKYQLPANMWGQEFVPQTAVLPLVDLVITHGGNNTVTEAFFFGKPILVMPLFSDQFENAQRILETGLGSRIDPFHCTEEELLSSVDQLVNDSKLRKRMISIGNRIRSNDDKQQIADSIEKIIKNQLKNTKSLKN